MKRSGIYKIQSIMHPERIYIGSAIDLKTRKATHFCNLKKGVHCSKKLQRHYNKYGRNDLIFSIIEPCFPVGLLAREQYYLDRLNPYFNTCKIAGNTLGSKLSEETKIKISQALKGKKQSPRSAEARKNISDSLKGRIFSEEHKRKIGLASKGNKYLLGHRHSEETKLKISLTKRLRYAREHPFPKEKIIKEHIKRDITGANNPMYGRKHSAESKLKNRLSHLGKRANSETKKKLSLVHKGKPFSDEHKRKLSIAQKQSIMRKKEINNQIKKIA